MYKPLLMLLALAWLIGAMPSSLADDAIQLSISGRQFVPQSLALPAGKKVRITVHNQDKLPAEFESYDLSREIVVPPGAKVSLYVGPLNPGKYAFFDDFNPQAKGEILVQADSGDTP